MLPVAGEHAERITRPVDAVPGAGSRAIDGPIAPSDVGIAMEVVDERQEPAALRVAAQVEDALTVVGHCPELAYPDRRRVRPRRLQQVPPVLIHLLLPVPLAEGGLDPELAMHLRPVLVRRVD